MFDLLAYSVLTKSLKLCRLKVVRSGTVHFSHSHYTLEPRTFFFVFREMEGGQKLVKFEQLPEPMEDIEIEPLTGKPCFHFVVCKSHISRLFQLMLPAKFTLMLPLKMIPVILIRGSRSWEMNYHGHHSTHKRLDLGWRNFAVDNMLKLGDICLFELIECNDTLIKFKVQVLRGDFPSVLLDKEDGSHKNPVVIEDD